MRAGLYEARSLIGEQRIAYVLLEDVAAERVTAHRLRRAFQQIVDSRPHSKVRHVAEWALADVEEG